MFNVNPFFLDQFFGEDNLGKRASTPGGIVLSYQLIMADGHGTQQIPEAEKFSGGCPHYTPKSTAPYRGLTLPSLTEALVLLDNVALWPPPIRRAAIAARLLGVA